MIEADRQLAKLNARRKVAYDAGKKGFNEPKNSDQCRISVGTDYGAAVSNWLTAWERTGDLKYRTWIENSMRSIGNSKWGFFSNRFEFDPKTKRTSPIKGEPPFASHLSIMFGLPEVVAELIQLIDVPEFKAAWLQYCEFCRAPREVLDQLLGLEYKPPGMPISHSSLLAYAAVMKGDPKLAVQAAKDLHSKRRNRPEPILETQRVEGPNTLNAVDEATWVSTNDSAQWGLAAIRASALIPKAISDH
ncbi:MAG: hypothetical protein GY801_12850 [bacterium]|nr:hypothetical protein [bacterium]